MFFFFLSSLCAHTDLEDSGAVHRTDRSDHSPGHGTDHSDHSPGAVDGTLVQLMGLTTALVQLIH